MENDELENKNPACKECGGKTHIVKQWDMAGGKNRIKQIVKILQCEDCGKRKRTYEKEIEAGVEE